MSIRMATLPSTQHALKLRCAMAYGVQRFLLARSSKVAGTDSA